MDKKHVCDKCGGGIAYPSEYAGTKTNCPHCNAEIILGSLSPAASQPSIAAARPRMSFARLLEGKYAIASLIAVAVVGVALFWIWPKRISGVFVGPENSIEGRTSTSYYRERLDIREDGFAQVKVGPFGRLEAGAYSLSGKTITIKIETKEDGSKREKAETMQFRLDGNDVVLVKHLAGYDKLGYEGQRWKRN